MGIVSTVQLIVGGCAAATISKLADAHLRKLEARAPGAKSRAAFDWLEQPNESFASLVLSTFREQTFDGVAAFGWEGKTSLWSIEDASLEPFFEELLRTQPDARLVASWETDHDEDGMASWSWRANVGAEESDSPGDTGWLTSRVPARLHGAGDWAEGGEDGEPKKKRARLAQGRQRLSAATVMRLDAEAPRRARASKVKRGACAAAVLDALSTKPSVEGTWPVWVGADFEIELTTWLRELGSFGMDLVVWLQREGRHASLVRITPDSKPSEIEPQVDLLWSPSCVSLAEWEPPPRDAIAAPASASAEAGPSKRRARPSLGKNARGVLEALPEASLVGIKNQPFFAALGSLEARARRELVEELAPLVGDASVVAMRDGGLKLQMVILSLLEFTSVIESTADAEALLAIARELQPGPLVSQLDMAMDHAPVIPGLSEVLLDSSWLATLAEGAPPPDPWNEKQPNVRAALLIAKAEGRPPFPVDAWGRAVRADLDVMPRGQAAAWGAFFAAVDADPPGFRFDDDVFDRGTLRRKVPAAARQAARWLEKFVELAREDLGPAPNRPEHERHRHARNLRLVEVLTHFVDLEGADRSAFGALARSLAEVSLAPLVTKASSPAVAPRLGYRAIDMLAEREDVEALRSIARGASFERVVAYAEARVEA